RRLYRQRPANGRRLCIDEFGPLHLLPRHGHCRKGPGQHVQRIPANYDRTKDVRHLLAYYDLETDRLYGRFTKRKTGKVFLSFLKWVRSRYPKTQDLHMVMRSEEHTSELQSLRHLVCRLLLEKKKKQ